MGDINLTPSILELTSLQEIRDSIAREISGTNGHIFSWCAEATTTTDTYVSDRLAELGYKPDVGATDFLRIKYNIGDLLGNMRAASDIIERVHNRRNELLNLEERAISTFLEYKLAESTQATNLKVAKVTLRAYRKASDAGPNDANENTLAAQDAAQTAARRTRLILHNTPGNPLNYGERIEQLRNLLVDSIVILLDRLRAIRIGMAHQNVFLAPSIPTWKPNDSNNIQNLNFWLRDVISAYESAYSTRREYTKAIFIGSSELITGGKAAIQAELLADKDHDISFQIHEENVLGIGKKSIVTGVSVAIVFSENDEEYKSAAIDGGAKNNPDGRSQFSTVDSWTRRRRESFSCDFTIQPPPQITDLEDGVAWQRPPVIIGNAPAAWVGGNRIADSEQVSGISPFGAWSIRFGKSIQNTDGTLHPISTVNAGGRILTPTDVVILFRIQDWGR
jgi:hypothetical protein